MTPKDRIKLLEEWAEQYKKCDNAWLQLEIMFRGLDCDSLIGRAVYGTFEKYMAAVSYIVGDNNEWLDWYLWENDMGINGMEAKASNWKKARKIKDLKDLCKLIEADLET